MAPEVHNLMAPDYVNAYRIKRFSISTCYDKKWSDCFDVSRRGSQIFLLVTRVNPALVVEEEEENARPRLETLETIAKPRFGWYKLCSVIMMFSSIHTWDNYHSTVCWFSPCFEGWSPGTPIFLPPEKGTFPTELSFDVDRGPAWKQATCRAGVASSLNKAIYFIF